MSIQVNKPKFHIDECLEQIKECLEKGWTGLGFKTVEFENEWKKYTGHKNAHFLNSATAGLHLAFQILKNENGWNDGDEVITTPITFVSTNHSIKYVNLTPRFADVDESLCLDPIEVRKMINDRTRAVVFVGYGGRVGKLLEIVDICKQNNLKLILDASHMAGTTANGIWPGTWDGIDVTIYSYQALKNLPTADSGMICFKNDNFDVIARKLSWLGISKDTYTRSKGNSYNWMYDIDYCGYKYNGNSIMASIALVQLKYLKQDNAYRHMLADIYNENLINNSKIKIVPYDKESSCHIYAIEVDNRDELAEYLIKNDILPGVHYRNNLEFPMYSYDFDNCPNAGKLSKRVLTLPLHLHLSDFDVINICNLLNKF